MNMIAALACLCGFAAADAQAQTTTQTTAQADTFNIPMQVLIPRLETDIRGDGYAILSTDPHCIRLSNDSGKAVVIMCFDSTDPVTTIMMDSIEGGMKPAPLFVSLNADVDSEIERENPCLFIARTANEVTGEIRVMTPMTGGMEFVESIVNSDTSYYVLLTVSDSTLYYGEIGATIKFDDSAMIRNEDVHITVASGSGLEWMYSALFALPQRDVATIRAKNIAAFNMYHHSAHINAVTANRFRTAINCVLQSHAESQLSTK